MITAIPSILNYEDLCNFCRQLVFEVDTRRWQIGDAALEIESHYGEHTLADFARDIGANQSTIRGYKRVSAFYAQAFRRNLLEEYPNLTYTYFRDAVRLNDIDLALEWLEEVSAQGWTADDAARRLTEKLGRQSPQASIEGIVSKVYQQQDGYYVVMRIVDSAGWKVGQVVMLRGKD